MPERTGFTHKFLAHFDRLDREAIRNYLKELTEEKTRVERLFDELEEGVVLTDEKGHLQLVNRAASLSLGFKNQPLPREKIQDLIEDPAIIRFIKEHLNDLTAKVVQDFQVLNPRESFLRLAMIPISSQTQKSILMIISNITEVKTRQSDQEQVARIETMVRLAGGLAHEIGNPLNSLNIHLELLRKEVKSLPKIKREALTKVLSVLNSETSRLDKIVRHFLKATRKPPLRFRMEDLNAILEEAVRFMAPELSDRGIAIQFRLDSTLAPFLMDRQRLYPVFINLIKNSMEAMADGGTIRVRISHKDIAAILRFQDNGRGIPEKDLPHIFEAYYTTKEEGSGLGLMTVYNHIADHGGKIEVASKVGKGTTFTIFLPIRRTKLQLTNEMKAS